MIIQGTETLSSFIHIVSESLLTPVMILIVVGLIVVILCIGGLINERISRKTISSEELESLVRDVSFSQSHSEIEKLIEESNLFDFQKNVLVKIANNYDIGSEARKALASELISAEETKLIKSTNKTDCKSRSYFRSFRYFNSFRSGVSSIRFWRYCYIS